MVKSWSYSPFRYAPWCFRNRRDVILGVALQLELHTEARALWLELGRP